MKDYYKILEVEENASEDEIKKSYRTLSKKYHPDMNPSGAEQFKDISEAYEILSSKDKREKYNYQRKNPYGNTPFEDLFSGMFNQRTNPFQNRRKSAPDKIVKLEISPIESFLGHTKSFQYMREKACNVCSGSGGELELCKTCGGQGFHIKTFGTGFMVQQIRSACPACGGRGQILIQSCYSCSGRGTKGTVESLDVKIPVGIDDGNYLKLENMGDFRNGELGDLVIQCVMVAKDNFEKINNDLVYNLYLNYEDLKKSNFTIPHPLGDLTIAIPKLFDTSKPLRLKSKGYFDGDMYVKLFVKFERD